jgi:hypothetical protein
MITIGLRLSVAIALIAGVTLAPSVADLLAESRSYVMLPADAFETLGWDLPEGGRQVKAIADAAPSGAFDPASLETVTGLGYRAKWHVLRYRFYGLDWDITGLKLTPDRPDPTLPVLAIIHGGSANWYEFFVDPLNRAGLGQYLAQRAQVMLVTIPGNYSTAGWTDANFERRIPGYVLDRHIDAEEARVRNAVFTFSMPAEGVRQLLEKTTTGPLLIIGHSTGGEFQFLLKNSSLRTRLRDRSLGWGTGGPAVLTKALDDAEGDRAARVEQYGRYPRVDTLRARDARGYVSSAYIGPLNPISGATPLAVAEGWFAAESVRRPQFKQVLQDMEHQGFIEHRARLEREIRETLKGRTLAVDADAVIKDLFSTMTPPLDGYAKMAWVVGKLDNGHWAAEPEDAREFQVAARFRQRNPNAPIRVLVIDARVTHYGHIERPKQLAAVLLDAARWVMAP